MSAPTAKQREKAATLLDDEDIDIIAQALADEREAALEEAASVALPFSSHAYAAILARKGGAG